MDGYPCIECGDLAIRPGKRCSACAERYRVTGQRALTAPIMQEGRPDLPPIGAVLFDDDGSRIQCHVCGAFMVRLPSHIRRLHGLNADQYKEQFGLARTTPLWSPQASAAMRIKNSDHLNRIRPPSSEIPPLPKEKPPRRLEVRIAHKQRLLARNELTREEREARKKPKAPAKPPSQLIEEFKARSPKMREALAFKMQDPDARARKSAKLRAAHRRITPEQEQEIWDQRHSQTQTALAKAYGTSKKTVRRIHAEKRREMCVV